MSKIHDQDPIDEIIGKSLALTHSTLIIYEGHALVSSPDGAAKLREELIALLHEHCGDSFYIMTSADIVGKVSEGMMIYSPQQNLLGVPWPLMSKEVKEAIEGKGPMFSPDHLLG